MARIRVSLSGLGKNFYRINASIIQDLSERQLAEIAKETERVIRQKISERIERKGSTGNLANSFTTVKLSDGWGVGDISFLNKQAPYWYWQNFGKAQSGRTTPPRSRGSFNGQPPNSGGGSDRWNQSSNGSFAINPTKPIEAKNYIDATISEINQIIADVTRRIKING